MKRFVIVAALVSACSPTQDFDAVVVAVTCTTPRKGIVFYPNPQGSSLSPNGIGIGGTTLGYVDRPSQCTMIYRETNGTSNTYGPYRPYLLPGLRKGDSLVVAHDTAWGFLSITRKNP